MKTEIRPGQLWRDKNQNYGNGFYLILEKYRGPPGDNDTSHWLVLHSTRGLGIFILFTNGLELLEDNK